MIKVINNDKTGSHKERIENERKSLFTDFWKRAKAGYIQSCTDD
jgi:hypothetical protein